MTTGRGEVKEPVGDRRRQDRQKWTTGERPTPPSAKVESGPTPVPRAANRRRHRRMQPLHDDVSPLIAATPRAARRAARGSTGSSRSGRHGYGHDPAGRNAPIIERGKTDGPHACACRRIACVAGLKRVATAKPSRPRRRHTSADVARLVPATPRRRPADGSEGLRVWRPAGRRRRAGDGHRRELARA